MAAQQPTFLRAKLHRPHAIAGSIERPRLLEKLDQVLQQPVTLISAPAGFGKTTLVSQLLDLQSDPSFFVLKRDYND